MSTKQSAIEAARRAIEAHPAYDCGSTGDEEMARAAIIAYLSAIAEDEASVEAVARAMHKQSRPLSDPDKLQPKPRGQVGMEPLWKMYEPMARAALAVLLSRAKEQQG